MTIIFNDDMAEILKLAKECIRHNPVGMEEGFNMDKFELELRRRFGI